nr:regulatory protein RecX [Chromobacterium haemolyticum]
MDDLAERSWQSDQRFAQQFADSKGQRYGSRRLQQEMRQRGVDAELIRDALQGRDDLAAAQAQWLKKFGRMPDTPQERARQIRFLAGRGFPMSVIGKVLSGVDDDDFPADED